MNIDFQIKKKLPWMLSREETAPCPPSVRWGGNRGRKVAVTVSGRSEVVRVTGKGSHAKWDAKVQEDDPRGHSGLAGDSTWMNAAQACDQRGKSSWRGSLVIVCYHFPQIQVFIGSFEYCNRTSDCKYCS